MTAAIASAFEFMKYGGIELKQNYKKFLGYSLGIAVALHVIFLLSFWIVQHWGDNSAQKNIPYVKLKLGDLAPPPSIQQNQSEPVSAAAPVAKPSIGVPVPVPDAEVSPEQQFSTLKELTESTGPQGDAIGAGQGQVVIPEEVKVEKKEDDDPYAFNAVEVDPQPKVDVRKYLSYPELARKANIEGNVYLRFKVLKNGTVADVIIEKSDHQILEEAAKEAIKKCTFTPAIQNGQPVDVWTSQVINFKLK